VFFFKSGIHEEKRLAVFGWAFVKGLFEEISRSL
jgi:hypothetical protein